MVDQSLGTAFQASRQRLHAIVFRMLGSQVEADDAVQDTWLRLASTDPERIDNLNGWLTTVVGRVRLDRLRSRRTRQEDLVGDCDVRPSGPRPCSAGPGRRGGHRRIDWGRPAGRPRLPRSRRESGLRAP